MQLIGHRGVCGIEPENTLRSFKKAFDLGLKMIELDIHLVEETLIVIHDSTLDRTTNGVGSIYDKSLAELCSLDAGEGEKIPTLTEVIEILPSDVTINIEMKGKGCAHALSQHLAPISHQCIVSSFHWDDLLTLKEICNEAKLGVLTRKLQPWDIATKIEAISVHPSIDFIDSKFVSTAHQQKLKIYPKFVIKSWK